MPDGGRRQALHHLCNSVSGVNWRPTRFEDELTVLRYACSVCDIVPSTTVVLPCSHVLCEMCVTGCVVQDGGSVCPLDTQPFCEDECQKLKLPAKTKHNMKAHCWNEADGCQFVGTPEAVLSHYDGECAFHAVQCRWCERKILRTAIAAHYVAGCSQNAYCASGGHPNRQDDHPTGYEGSANQDNFSAFQRQINEVLEVCRASDSARSQDISRAVSGFENTLQRGMESIEANICTTVTRQLNADVEELRASNRDPCSDRLSSLRSHVIETVEQSGQRDAFQIQEIGRVLRDSQSEVKEDVNVRLQEIVSVVRASGSEMKNTMKTLLEELVHVLRDSICQLKQHVSRVEANLSSRLTDQQVSLQGALNSLKQNKESTERAVPFGAAASGREDIPWHFKLDVLVNDSLNTLEYLRQHIYRHYKQPWVPTMEGFPRHSSANGRNDFQPKGFYVTLENCENIFYSDRRVFTVTNKYFRDMRIQIVFSTCTEWSTWFWVNTDCVKTSGDYSFPFTELTVKAARSSRGGFVPFDSILQRVCTYCFGRRISHHCALLCIDKGKLAENDVMENGKLTLQFQFK